MYKVLLYHYRDGFETDYPTEADRTLYNDESPREDLTVLTATGKDSITELPTFDFTILPNHPLYGEIVKFKTWITVYKDSNVLFHGRVLSDGSDFYGQKTVSCEGALGCLLDSVLEPASAQTETPKAHLQRIITEHNGLMSRTPYPEPYKCFTVGDVTIDEAETSKKFEKQDSYSQTRSAIDSDLLGEYKGYLYVRYENGTMHLDWLKSFNRVNSQSVKMAVNLLDRSLEESADEYYTIMLPIGTNKVTIDGKYLEDSAAIQRYGRIYKAESFSDKKKKAALLEEAQKEFAKRGSNLPLSVRIKAVDMFLLGEDVLDLRVGDNLTNVEDRDGNFFSNLTVAEITYDLFNPANDEYILENQEALDKRNTSQARNGTLSGRAGGGSKDLFEETKDLFRQYDNLTLEITNDYSLTANKIHEASKYHEIITGIFDLLADESNVQTEDNNVASVKFKTFYINNKYGWGDYVRRGDKTYMFTGEYTPGMGWNAAVEEGLVTETGYGESIEVKTIYGTHTHQDTSGQTTVIQDVTGILLDKVKPNITDFSTEVEYHEGDYVRYDGKIYRCLYNHKGEFNLQHFGFVDEGENEANLWTYSPVYQTDELGNEVVSLLTGEKEYQIVDGNLDGVPVTNPIKSITKRTQTEFYDVIGTTSTYQSIANDFSQNASYSIGQAVKYQGKFYWFIANHQGPWDWDHVEPLTEMATVNGEQMYTLTSMHGSTLFHNEKELDQIVGDLEIVQTKDNDGKVVGRNLVIKNGSGLRARDGSSEVGIFENGELNAGLLVSSLNNNSGTIKAMQFSTDRNYAVGDYVQYNGTIYRCTTEHKKSAWDSSHFTVANGYIAKLKADILDLGDYATVGMLQADYITANQIQSIYATIDRLETLEGDFETLISGESYAGSLSVTGSVGASSVGAGSVSASNYYIMSGDDSVALGLKSIKAGTYVIPNISVLGHGGTTIDIPDAITDLDISLSSNTYTLRKKTFSSDNWTDIGTFSRATSLNGEWSGGVYTVTATPQNTTDTTSLTVGGHWGVAANNENVNTYYATISATRNSQATVYATGKTFEVNAADRYNAGYDTASSQVVLPGEGSSASFAINYPKTTTTGGTTTRNQSLTSYALEPDVLTVSMTSGSGSNKVVHAKATCSDANLVAANIKNGVSIFGVTGTYVGTASNGTITGITLNGNAAYADGVYVVPVKATGTNLTNSGNQYTTTINVSPLHTTLNVTSNGTYTPSSGYAGYSSVTVDVPGEINNMTLSNNGTTEPTTDYAASSRLGRNNWYVITATTDTGDTKTFKARGPSVSNSFNTVTEVPSGKTVNNFKVGTLRRLLITVNGSNIVEQYWTAVT